MQEFTDADFEAVAGNDYIPDDSDITLNPLLLSRTDLDNFARETAIVEICIKTGESRVVDTSDAPGLTHEVLTTAGSRRHTAKVVFDGDVREVILSHGKSIRTSIEYNNLIDSFEGRDLQDPTEVAALNLQIMRFMIAKSFREPLFSYEGQPPEDANIADCFPVEDCPQTLLADLWECYQELHNPTGEPEWYQIEVLKGIPLDVSLMTGKGFDWSPVGGERLKINEMPDDEIEKHIETQTAYTRTLVASMILTPPLSIDDNGLPGAYPLERLSEFFIQMLFNSNQSVNAPDPTRQLLSNLYDRGQTEIGKASFIEIGRIGRDYGKRPSELIRGDPIDLSIDSIISRVYWKHEHDEHERRENERNSK